jgi:excisionase family DNA binding protein
MKKFYTVKEAAKILGVSTNTLYKYLDQGSLKGKRHGVGGRFRIPASEMSPYLATEEAAAVPVATGGLQGTKKSDGILLTAVGLSLGLFLGLAFFNFSTSPILSDIAVATWNYSGRTSQKFGSYVAAETPKLAASTKKVSEFLALRVESGKLVFNQARATSGAAVAGASTSIYSQIHSQQLRRQVGLSLLSLAAVCLLTYLVITFGGIVRRRMFRRGFSVKSKSISIKGYLCGIGKLRRRHIGLATYLLVVFTSAAALSLVVLAIIVKAGKVPVALFEGEEAGLSKMEEKKVESTENPVLVNVPVGTKVNIREEADPGAEIIAKVAASKVADKIAQDGDWTEVAIAGFPSGWVNNSYIKAQFDRETEVLGKSAGVSGKKVNISETPTGWLRVRNAPQGAEIGRVYPGDSFNLLDQNGNWLLIEMSAGASGWISSDYATIQ